MSTEPAPVSASLRTDLAVRNYLLVCLVALLVLMLNELERGLNLLTVLPVLAAALGLVIRSSLATLAFLFTLGLQLFLYPLVEFGSLRWGFFRARRFEPADVALCGAVLAYVVAHYRLAALVKNIFPPDPRHREIVPGQRRSAATTREVRQRRSPRLVGPVEWAVFLLTIPVWPLLAQLLWLRLPGPWTITPIPAAVVPWTTLLVPLWLLAAVLFLARGLLNYWRGRNMSAEEGQMVLQDVLWKETRREQRRVNRWLAWDRLRRQSLLPIKKQGP